MSPSKSQEIFDAYKTLIELTAKQNLESLQDIDNAIRSRKELTANQREALLEFSKIEYRINASSDTKQPPHLLTEDSIPLRSFSACPWCGRETNDCHCGMRGV